MRLQKIRKCLEESKMEYIYTEVEDCGSLDFDYRGVPYHIWEFHDDEWGGGNKCEKRRSDGRYHRR